MRDVPSSTLRTLRRWILEPSSFLGAIDNGKVGP